MAVRLSQLYAQVVHDPDQSAGELRVRRMYASVLVSGVGGGPTTINESVNQAITFVQSAHGFNENQQSDQTLNLTQNVVVNRVLSRTVADTLVFSTVAAKAVPATVNQSLGLVELIFPFNLVGDRKPAGNVLAFVQTVELSSRKTVEQTLSFVQDVNVQYPTRLSVNQHISFVSHTSTPHRAFINDEINFVHYARIPIPTQHITQNLVFEQDSPIGRVDQTLEFVQTVSIGYLYEITQNLGIADQVQVQGEWVRTVTHDNILGHALTWYEDTPCGRKQYTPFQGESTLDSELASPRNTLQDPQGTANTFSLYTPYLGVPTNQVILRAPELDNRDRNAYTRVNSETRGGHLIVYSDPQWPHIRTLAVTVVGLIESEVDEFQTFVQATLGQEIGLTDWEGRLWKGVITTPDDAATQDGKKRWTITFEFEGEMLEVEQPGDNGGNGASLNLTQSVTAVIV